MLGEVTVKVFSSFMPVQIELVLFDAEAHPVETHVKSLGALLAHVSSEDSVGGRAVGLDWGGQLWVAYVNEAVRMETVCWPLSKIAPVSASAVESMKVHMV